MRDLDRIFQTFLAESLEPVEVHEIVPPDPHIAYQLCRIYEKEGGGMTEKKNLWRP